MSLGLAGSTHPKTLKPVRSDLIENWIEREERQAAGGFANSDATTFWNLWLEHQQYLFAVCLKQMQGIHADAEDALSLAMLKAWKKFPDYAHQITSPGAWLAKLTHNLCLDLHRERRRRTRCIESLDAGDDVQAGSDESSESNLLRVELRNKVLRTIDGLPQRLREPFLLRVLQEMPYPAVAAHLAISPQNARKRIQQARALLQQKLRETGTAQNWGAVQKLSARNSGKSSEPSNAASSSA